MSSSVSFLSYACEISAGASPKGQVFVQAPQRMQAVVFGSFASFSVRASDASYESSFVLISFKRVTNSFLCESFQYISSNPVRTFDIFKIITYSSSADVTLLASSKKAFV